MDLFFSVSRVPSALQPALRRGTMNSLQYLSTTLQWRTSLPAHAAGDGDGGPPPEKDSAADGDDQDSIAEEDGLGKQQDTGGGEEEESTDPSGISLEAQTAAGVSSYVLYSVLFVPRILVYVPICCLLSVLFYPLRKLYQLGLFLVGLDEGDHDHSEYQDLSVDDADTQTPQPGSTSLVSLATPSSADAVSNNGDENASPAKAVSAPSTPSPPSSSSSAKSTGKYAPKSSISTILEESMEFDPDYHENDDYFKSPSDSNPITPSIHLIPDTDTPSKPSKVSRLNYKLLQAVNSTPSLSAGSLEGANADESGIPATPVPAVSSASSAASTAAELKPSSDLAPSATLTSASQAKRKKKKKFIFPKLLFDFNIFEPPKLPRKTLVLDLDETLIHSLSRYNSSTLNKTKGRSIEVKVMGNLPTLYHIYKRPYVEEFLSVVYQWFDLVCFTASIKEYADPVIDYLEEQVLSNDVMKKSLKKLQADPPTRLFKTRYYRNSCIFAEGKGYLKDLSVVLNDESRQPQSRSNSRTRSRASSISSNVSRSASSKGFDYSKIIIIDNSPISYVRHKDNGLMIEGWINDPEDTELMNLLPLLNSLRFVSDVRCILGLKEGQRAFA